MPMVRAMRLLNAIEAGTTTGAQLQTLLAGDAGRLGEFNALLGMRGQARRLAASSTAMAAVIASSTAMAAVIASSTAMAAVAASKTALLACWNSETALAALRANSTALTALVASPHKSTLGGHNPSDLQSTMIAGKVILLRSYNSGGSDTNYLNDRFSNGASTGNYTYNTTTSYSTQMLAFQGIRHYNWSNNYTWYGDVVKVD